MGGQAGFNGAVEGTNSQVTMYKDVLDLPPGFRFHPTDEEVVTYYLTPKVIDPDFTAAAIVEIDLNKCEPWDIPSRSKIGEKDRYFFCQKDRKYPTGTRTNRATKAGYWKATGKDKEIYRGRGKLVGMKKTLVFYKGRAPKGEKTNWVIHEFRIEGKFPDHHLHNVNKDEWVVCRVFNKTSGGIFVNNDNELLENSCPPPLVDPSNTACCRYSSKWDYGDLVEGKSPTGAGHLPCRPVQNHNPFGNSVYSLHGLMDSQFSEGFQLCAHQVMSEQFTLSMDEIDFDAKNEISSAATTLIDGVYYGYLESSLMDCSDDFDLTLESLMNQEHPRFSPIDY